MGNAYSDEILWAAKLSPFKTASRLDSEEIAPVVRGVDGSLCVRPWNAASARRPRELKDAKRAGMSVHGRAGQACPKCGSLVRRSFLSNRSFQVRPQCQTGGKVLADRRLSKLLK